MTLDRTQATATTIPSVMKPHMHRGASWLSVRPPGPSQHARQRDPHQASPLKQRAAACRGTCQHCFQRGQLPDKPWPGAPALKKSIAPCTSMQPLLCSNQQALWPEGANAHNVLSAGERRKAFWPSTLGALLHGILQSRACVRTALYQSVVLI